MYPVHHALEVDLYWCIFCSGMDRRKWTKVNWRKASSASTQDWVIKKYNRYGRDLYVFHFRDNQIVDHCLSVLNYGRNEKNPHHGSQLIIKRCNTWSYEQLWYPIEKKPHPNEKTDVFLVKNYGTKSQGYDGVLEGNGEVNPGYSYIWSINRSVQQWIHLPCS